MTDDQRLDDLAGRILDGKGVDWRTEASQGGTDGEAMLAELKVLAEIVELHRRDQLGRDEDAPGQETIPRTSVAEEPGIGTWGTLTLIEKVGEGAFAEVYRARDPHLDRDVALKLLREGGSDPGRGAAVIEEGRLLAAVRHPNVIVVHGAGTFAGRVGIWTEFVQGQTLEDVLADHGPFGAHETALIGIDLCRALAAVHGAGVIHRDVKARNVMRERGGRLVLMDFGMGAVAAEAQPERGSSGGTPLYMAPELFDGGAATVPSDIYAVGVLLWHLLTGAYPVTGADLNEVRDAHRSGRRQRLLDMRPDLPAATIAAVERALEPDSAKRFATAGAMEAALDKALHADPSAATRPGRTPAEPQEPQARRRAWMATMSVVGLIAAGGVGAYLTSSGPGSTPASETAPASTATVRRPVVPDVVAGGPVAPRAPEVPRPESGAPPPTAGATSSVGPEERPSAPAGVAALAPGTTRWVLIGAFENQSGQASLTGTIEAALEHEMEQSPVVRVVPPQRVQDALRLMKQPPDTPITAAISLEVARRDELVGAVVQGRLVRLSAQLHLEARVVEPRTGRSLGILSAVAASADGLPAAAARLARDVRRKLGESADQLRGGGQDLERVTTASSESLRLYSESVKALARKDEKSALALARAAVAADASFASAHALEASLLKDLGKREEARAAIERAAALSGSVTEPERLFIDALHLEIQGKRDEATAAYEAYLQLRPDDHRVLERVVIAYGTAGRFEDLARAEIRAATLRPNDFTANYRAAWYGMVYGGKLAEIRSFVARASALETPDDNPASAAWIRFEPVFEAWLTGDARGAADRLDAAARTENRDQTHLAFLAAMNLAFGRLRAAEAAVDRVPDRTAPLWFVRAEIAWARGDVSGARSALQSVLGLPPVPALGVNRIPALLVRAGMTDEADAIVSGQPAETKQSHLGFPPAEGEIALARGDLARATERLSGWEQLAAGVPARVVAALTYAEALERSGRATDAARVLESLYADRTHLYQRASLPLLWAVQARALQARVYRALDRAADADRIDAELRRLLAFADPDFVVLKQLQR